MTMRKVRAGAGLATLSLLFFVVTAGTFTSLGVVLPDMVKALHWDWTQAGLGYTILGVACGLASYVPALAIRRAGVRATLLVGAAIMAAGFASLAMARGTQLYFLGSALTGGGFALVAVIPGTFVLQRLFTHSSTAFGVYFTAGALGGVAGPFLYAGARAIGADWRLYWWMLSGVILAVGALAALASPGGEDAQPVAQDPAMPHPVRDFTVRQALATPAFWIITAAYTAYLLCETSVNGLSVPHLIDRGVAPAVAGATLALQALTNAVARAGAGWLGEQINPRRLVAGALLAVVVGIGALAVGQGYAAMGVYVVGVGVGYGVSYLATTVLLLNTFGRTRNLELFSIMCLVSTLAAAGPWIGGYVKDRFGGFEAAFWLFAAFALAALIAVVLMRPPREPLRPA